MTSGEVAASAGLAERHGMRHGDRVAALAANSPEYLDALFACALLGAILTPLNWWLTPAVAGGHPARLRAGGAALRRLCAADLTVRFPLSSGGAANGP